MRSFAVFLVAASAALVSAGTNCANQDATCRLTPNDPRVSSCTEKKTDCEAICERQNNNCRIGPNANQAFCSAQYASCLGRNPYATGTATSTAPASTGTISVSCVDQDKTCRSTPNDPRIGTCDEKKTTCESICQDFSNNCRIGPNANQAFCSSNYASCLGYNPYDTSSSASVVTATATATGSSSTATGSVDCTTQDNKCRTAPNANQAFCSSQIAQCKDTCQTKSNACRTAPNANQAFCSSQFAGCLGYNPYTEGASTATATAGGSATATAGGSTATSSAATDCTTQDNKCRTAPNANQAFCSSQIAQCKDTCQTKSNACRTAPNANQAYCSSQFAACLGYNPYTQSASGTAAATATATGLTTATTVVSPPVATVSSGPVAAGAAVNDISLIGALAAAGIAVLAM